MKNIVTIVILGIIVNCAAFGMKKSTNRLDDEAVKKAKVLPAEIKNLILDFCPDYPLVTLAPSKSTIPPQKPLVDSYFAITLAKAYIYSQEHFSQLTKTLSTCTLPRNSLPQQAQRIGQHTDVLKRIATKHTASNDLIQKKYGKNAELLYKTIHQKLTFLLGFPIKLGNKTAMPKRASIQTQSEILSEPLPGTWCVVHSAHAFRKFHVPHHGNSHLGYCANSTLDFFVKKAASTISSGAYSCCFALAHSLAQVTGVTKLYHLLCIHHRDTAMHSYLLVSESPEDALFTLLTTKTEEHYFCASTSQEQTQETACFELEANHTALCSQMLRTLHAKQSRENIYPVFDITLPPGKYLFHECLH